MADNTSGIGSQPPHNPPAAPKAKVEPSGEFDNQSVTSHSPKGNQLDRTQSKTAKTPLKERKVVQHQQNTSIQGHDLGTIRHLTAEKKWQAATSAIVLHVKTPEQLDEVLAGIKVFGELPKEVQKTICDHFTQLHVTRAAGIIGSQLPADPVEELDVLMSIIPAPYDHDSPIGMVSRFAVKAFLDKHSLPDINPSYVVQNTCEQSYQALSSRVNDLVNQIKASTGNSELQQQLTEFQNEQRIESNYRQEIMAKA